MLTSDWQARRAGDVQQEVCVLTSYWQARGAGDELEEVSLLTGAVVGEDSEEEADGARGVSVAVIDATRLAQVASVPRLARATTEQLLQLQTHTAAVDQLAVNIMMTIMRIERREAGDGEY